MPALRVCPVCILIPVLLLSAAEPVQPMARSRRVVARSPIRSDKAFP